AKRTFSFSSVNGEEVLEMNTAYAVASDGEDERARGPRATRAKPPLPESDAHAKKTAEDCVEGKVALSQYEARGIIAKYKKWLEKDLKRKLRVKVGVLKAPPKSEE
ncbi:unnamed protein product, partial [Effrenium voratum]